LHVPVTTVLPDTTTDMQLPLEQTVPHPPQFLGSEEMSMQLLGPQHTSGVFGLQAL
jgi:hypothetical protein